MQCEFDVIVTQVLKFAYVNCSFGNIFSSASKLKIKVVAGVYVLARGPAISGAPWDTSRTGQN